MPNVLARQDVGSSGFFGRPLQKCVGINLHEHRTDAKIRREKGSKDVLFGLTVVAELVAKSNSSVEDPVDHAGEFVPE